MSLQMNDDGIQAQLNILLNKSDKLSYRKI